MLLTFLWGTLFLWYTFCIEFRLGILLEIKISMKRKFLFGGGFLFVITVIVLVSRATVFAGTSEDTQGWLWGGSDDGAGNTTGLGWVSTNSVSDGSPVSYGLNIPGVDGPVTGYAWSENIGWIDFNPQAHCGSAYTASSCVAPAGGNGGVSRSSNNLVGWARIVGIATESFANNSGGWSGWISMSQSTGGGAAPYGVIINAGNTLGGYAWSDELGWIDFNKAKIQGTNQLVVCPSAGVTLLAGGTSKALHAFYFADYIGVADCNTPAGANVSVGGIYGSTTWSSANPGLVTVAPNASSLQADVTPGTSSGSSTIAAKYNNIITSVPVTVVAVPGACGSPASICLSSVDVSTPNLCNPGAPVNIHATGTSWMWDCNGFGGGATAINCSKAKCAGHFIEVAP